MVKGLNSEALDKYLELKRPPSPARHAAISKALNSFALQMARMAVEELYSGKLLYAGGDDVLAMAPIDELPSIMVALRCLYSGIDSPCLQTGASSVISRGGHVQLGSRLYRVMGKRAKASMGAVIAHYSAPMGMVLRELRRAEQAAKQISGKDAFAITLLKRSGGSTTFASKWFVGRESRNVQDADSGPTLETLALVKQLSGYFRKGRRAAYHLLEWLAGLEKGVPKQVLEALIHRELRRHLSERGEESSSPATVDDPARRLREAPGECPLMVQVAQTVNDLLSAAQMQSDSAVEFLRQCFTLAEFLSREGRS